MDGENQPTELLINFLDNASSFVMVNSRFLQHPQKRSRGNQLIYSRAGKT